MSPRTLGETRYLRPLKFGWDTNLRLKVRPEIKGSFIERDQTPRIRAASKLVGTQDSIF